MSEELWIEGLRFDLGDRTVSQTFQINDLSNLKDRQGNYSNTIRAPKTPNNIEALNYLGIAGNQSRSPYRKLKAKYIVGGVELVSGGYTRITSTDDTIDINIYSGNVSLMNVIKGKKINELNFDDLNHFLNPTSISEGVRKTDGYVYALGNFGYNENLVLIAIERQSPSLYFHSIWNKIFSESGITYSGDFFENNESFKSEVLPPTKGYEVNNEVLDIVNLGAFYGDTARFLETTNKPTNYNYDFSFAIGGPLTNVTIIDPKHVRIDNTGVMTIYVDSTYTINFGTASINIVRNGVAVKYFELSTNNSTVSSEINIVANIGDIISVCISGENEKTDPDFPVYKIDIQADAYLQIDKKTGGVFIDFKEISTKMFQADFIKDIMQRYGLIFESKGNHYNFIQMETLCNSRNNAEDWSDKISTLGSEDYEFGNYAINNILKYKYIDGTSDFPQDGIIISDNEHLSSEKEMFISAFTISQQISTLINQPIYSIPIWEAKFDDDGVLKEIKIKEISPRIFKVKKYNGTVNLKFFDSTPISITDEIPFLSLENIQMDFYISNYYKAFNRILNAPHVRSSIFYLSPIDICQLDFFRLKYLKQFGKYFYLNKVSSYTPSRLTKCELIQINGISAGVVDGNQPPTQLGIKEFTTEWGTTIPLKLSDFVDTVPAYFDPEYDAPQQIKIISFGSSKIKIKNNDVIINADTIVDANNFNLSIQDLGLTNQPHFAEFNFKIQSFNNINFSEVFGTIHINIIEKINRPPVADAGTDILFQIEPDIGGNDYDFEQYLNGCNSFDPDGDALEFLWELIDAPAVGVALVDDLICAPLLSVHIENGSDLIAFQIKLTVTDSLGLEDSDTINVTLTNLSEGYA